MLLRGVGVVLLDRRMLSTSSIQDVLPNIARLWFACPIRLKHPFIVNLQVQGIKVVGDLLPTASQHIKLTAVRVPCILLS